MKKRLERLEAAHATERAVPFLLTYMDGTCTARGEPTTLEAWQARWGAQIEAEARRGRQVFGVNFSEPDEPTR